VFSLEILLTLTGTIKSVTFSLLTIMLAPVKLQRVYFAGHEAITNIHDIAAAIVVPTGYRTLATSGHVGVDGNGKLADSLREQIRITFEVRQSSASSTCIVSSTLYSWRLC
jgi:hypothetical protein